MPQVRNRPRSVGLLLRRSLLAALLAAPARLLMAQPLPLPQLPLSLPELATGMPPAPGPTVLPPLPPYRGPRVRTVLVLSRSLDEVPPGPRPRPVGYYEYDAQGRPTRWYESLSPSGPPLFTGRYDLTYRPAGEVATTTFWFRLPAPADTALLGGTWLAGEVTQRPPLPGTGQTAGWREETGDWQVRLRSRRWQSHDTLYQQTTNALTGRLNSCERTYPTPDHLLRHDRLLLGEQGPVQAFYTYQCFGPQHQLLELGRLDFGGDMEPTGRFGHATLARDELARHAPGQRRPLLTQTFGPAGQPLSSTSATGGRVLFRYAAAGQLATAEQTEPGGAVLTWHYSWLPTGLPASVRVANPTGSWPSYELLYRYTYYP